LRNSNYHHITETSETVLGHTVGPEASGWFRDLDVPRGSCSGHLVAPSGPEVETC